MILQSNSQSLPNEPGLSHAINHINISNKFIYNLKYELLSQLGPPKLIAQSSQLFNSLHSPCLHPPVHSSILKIKIKNAIKAQ